MTKHQKQFEERMHKLSHIRLSEADKARTRSFLKEYVAMNPIRSSVSNTSASQKTRNYWRSIMENFSFPARIQHVALACILIIGLSGGTALASEGSLPGDTLYPVKVNIVEEMLAAFSLSPEAKINWELERTERRLEETSRLAALKRLTERESAEIGRRLEHHVTTVLDYALQFEALDSIEAAFETEARLNAMLSSYARVLSHIQRNAESEEERTPVAYVLKHMNTNQVESSGDGMEAVAMQMQVMQDDAPPSVPQPTQEVESLEMASSVMSEEQPSISFEPRREAAAHHIANAEQIIEQLSEKVSPRVAEEGRETLAEAKAVFRKGEEAVERGDHEEALGLFSTAFQLALESRSFMSTRVRIADVTSELGLENEVQDPEPSDPSDHEEGMSHEGPLREMNPPTRPERPSAEHVGRERPALPIEIPVSDLPLP